MKLFWTAAVIIPLLALLTYLLLKGSPIPTFATYKSPEWITLVGTCLSYVGLLFSAFAAIKVGELSNRYFARKRLPEIRLALSLITKEMADAASRSAGELRSAEFLSRTAVELRAISRIKGHSMRNIVKRAEKQHGSLMKWLSSPGNYEQKANQENQYWTLFQTLNEISQEIGTQLKEQEAR